MSELSVSNVPEEIAPLVASFNSLLRRLRERLRHAAPLRAGRGARTAHAHRRHRPAAGEHAHDMNCPAAPRSASRSSKRA
jgi:hypothetical protein